MKDDADPFTFDFSTVDPTQCVADREAIRKVNPHRFEMELLSGVVMVDMVKHVIVGYADTTPDDFWCRGHMPGYPLMPGVLMVETAAQLVSFFAHTCGFVEDDKIMGLSGVDEARFVKQVRPGDRLVIAAKAIKLSRRIVRCKVIGAVNGEKTFEAIISGVLIPKTKEPTRA